MFTLISIQLMRMSSLMTALAIGSFARIAGLSRRFGALTMGGLQLADAGMTNMTDLAYMPRA